MPTSGDSDRESRPYAEYKLQPVPINDRVVGWWAEDHLDENLRFLRNFEVDFFSQIAKQLSTPDDGKMASASAMHVRLLRDQSFETMFALLLSLLQAPQGTVLWLYRYRTEDLVGDIKRLRTGHRFLTQYGYVETSLAQLVVDLHRLVQFDDADVQQRSEDFFSRFLERASEEFTDLVNRRESNAIKHGLRMRGTGQIKVRFGEFELTGSDTGGAHITFRSPQGHASHFSSIFHLVSWSTASMINQIEAAEGLIDNIIRALKGANGEDEVVGWFVPTNESAFDDCWVQTATFSRASGGADIDFAGADLPTPSKLKKLCESGWWRSRFQ